MTTTATTDGTADSTRGTSTPTKARKSQPVRQWARDARLLMCVTPGEAVSRTAGHMRFSDLVAESGDGIITETGRVDLTKLTGADVHHIDIPTVTVARHIVL